MQSLLRRHGENISSRHFSASGFVASLPENSRIAYSGNGDDLSGGFHENLKNIFRTANIGTNIHPANADFSMLLLQDLYSDRQWKCLMASQMGVSIIFAEASFFGAYAGYHDPLAPYHQKKAFGYVLDDLGYFFDASQPSRLETILNSSTFQLDSKDIARCQKLIQQIKDEKITKYNKYAGQDASPMIAGSVLVVDQKLSDASVAFGGGSAQTFQEMIAAAVSENPGRKVYLKRHPDNIHNNKSAFPKVPSLVSVLPDDCDVTSILDSCHAVYTVSSQVSFEALLRDKKVVTFGMPFYSGWGLTDDRQKIRRRTQARTIEELFHTACIRLSVYYDPRTRKLIEIEGAFDLIREMRNEDRQALQGLQ